MIHKFRARGKNILLDVNSGGVHVIDDLTFDLLDAAEPPFEGECPVEAVERLSDRYASEDIRECYGELRQLYEEKVLYSEDAYGEFADTSS